MPATTISTHAIEAESRNPARHATLALSLALLLLAFGCAEPGRSSAPPAREPARFAVHIASTEPDNQLTLETPGRDGHPLFLDPTPLITGRDLLRATPDTATDGRPALTLELTDDGAARLRDAADSYIDRILAFVWDDRIIYAPRARAPLSHRLMIVTGPDTLHALADWINARGE